MLVVSVVDDLLPGENSPVLIPVVEQVAKLCFLAKSKGSPFGPPLLTGIARGALSSDPVNLARSFSARW